MKTTTARRLLHLNRRFYDTFAAEFAASRSALQPGIVRALGRIGVTDVLLDVGCGDARVGRALAAGQIPHASARHYVGVDSSPAMLGQTALPDSELAVADFSRKGWTRQIARSYDAVVCFSALHHLPGPRRRLRLLRDLHGLLRPGGWLAISVWQFLHVPRLRRKIVPWRSVGLSADDVDESDYLLDWQRGGRGLRYVHQFEESELIGLCHKAGLTVHECFRSDGETGDMGLYVLARKPA